MKDILKKQIFFIPILYVSSKFLWGLIPISCLPDLVKMVINDFTGPAALMSIIFFILFWIGWRVPGIKIITQYLFGTKPNIQGTWQGKLSYEYEGIKKEKTVYLAIRQSDGYSMNIWFLTDERTSSSVFADIVPYKGGERIYYSYETEDSSKNKEKNPLHNGFCRLDIGANADILKGMYHTSRKTSGELFFDKIKKKTVMDYESAQKLFGIQ